ncbi:MAG: glyoxalase [Verrucomicrobia bacterium CG_4_10_14_3_um_filter_43_23]|nr:MAG: glyoxalase [Verrucomicrobia bacterium CG1_02_43_26]PIP59968.1 MAG: glyoxalase [Verrucomicrobia bacterium CG22_combo_CG10-13_8_21_14_all_43_17]PIX58019.1 MAG: glyoxalase [Verrucomicrobia bacterium CG_4_10_14_3_um_filter_43_23]PIY61879.1 MAG: glyoxalase [Verrucomicrobia bacterium CG_4_10_14_0_8_um_filter_43_34]PJA43961.1 MAG: glyoxalase [Verrucomicrobia bacterium CG_4_9_14_3_um_filter_43_20]
MKKDVQPVPSGFHTITPHLIVKDAANAIEFYKKAFGAEELGRMPAPGSNKIIHALLRIGDSMIMLVDEFPELKCFGPNHFNGTSVNIHLFVNDADGMFNQAVNAGAKAAMPMQDAFWGSRYGKVEDPFGHVWEIATQIEDVSPAEMKKRSDEYCASTSKA